MRNLDAIAKGQPMSVDQINQLVTEANRKGRFVCEPPLEMIDNGAGGYLRIIKTEFFAEITNTQCMPCDGTTPTGYVYDWNEVVPVASHPGKFAGFDGARSGVNNAYEQNGAHCVPPGS